MTKQIFSAAAPWVALLAMLVIAAMGLSGSWGATTQSVAQLDKRFDTKADADRVSAIELILPAKLDSNVYDLHKADDDRRFSYIELQYRDINLKLDQLIMQGRK